MSFHVGDVIREVKVTPDKHLTIRYAGASGDFNPIHVDDEFAHKVGLPGKILHGLYTMAQVARANGVTVIEPIPWFCTDVCPVVVGNILVWKDNSHLTTKYAALLTPLLEARLREVLGG